MDKDDTNRRVGKIKNIKRVGLISTLAVGMMLSLAACGTNEATSQPAATVGTAASATQPSGVDAAIQTPVGTDGTMSNTPQTSDASGSATSTPGTEAGQGDGSAAVVEATLREWALDLSQKEVPAGTVRFVVTNAGQFNHNLTVTDSNGQKAKTPNFKSSDGQQILEVELTPGTYGVICDLPGHASRGQKNELIVK